MSKQHPWETPFPVTVWSVILAATIIHVIKAQILLTDPEAVGSIGLAALLSVIPNRFVLAVVLVSAAIPALWSLWSEHKGPILAALCCMPQLALLHITAMGAWMAVLQGHYADMVVRTPGFIEADQLHRMLMPWIYTTAVYMRVQIAILGHNNKDTEIHH